MRKPHLGISNRSEVIRFAAKRSTIILSQLIQNKREVLWCLVGEFTEGSGESLVPV